MERCGDREPVASEICAWASILEMKGLQTIRESNKHNNLIDLYFLRDQLDFRKEAGKGKGQEDFTFNRVPRMNTISCFTGRELP